MFDPSKAIKKILGPVVNVPKFGARSPMDLDGDGIPNLIDCQPLNMFRQDINPNILVRERIKNLPIFYITDVSTKDRSYSINHIYNNKTPKAIQYHFHRAIKRDPGILGDIEQTGTEILLFDEQEWKKGEEVSMIPEHTGGFAYLGNEGKIVGIKVKKNVTYNKHPSLVYSHELKHIHQRIEDPKDFKPARTDKEYRTSKIELDAELYAHRKLMEAKDEPAIKTRLKYLEKTLKGETPNKSLAIKEIEKESEKELSMKKEQKNKMFRGIFDKNGIRPE